MLRYITFWRVVAVLALVLFGTALWQGRPPTGPAIARVEVLGPIFDDPARDALFDDIAGSDRYRAMILRIDSPGGSTAGSEALFAAIRRVAEEKPVVAVMGEVAASGGYIAAIAAEHIVARGNTLTGSIGVLGQYPDVSGLMERIGLEIREIKSSPLKAAPSPFEAPSEQVVALERALIADSYQWFRGLVGERRGLEGAALDAVADGRVFTGRLALEAGLVDAIGGETEAVAWLVDAGVGAMPVEDRAVEEDGPGTLAEAIFDLVLGGSDGQARRWAARLSGPKLMSVLN